MTLLFISSKDVNRKSHGGFQCTNRNYLSFCELFNAENVHVLNLSRELNRTLRSRLPKWLNYARGFNPGLSHETIKQIIEIAKATDYVFIDSSQFGVLAYYLKKAKCKGKIISFFHNVEYRIWLEKAQINPFNLWRAILMYYNEKKAVKYSHGIVTLNNRDSAELKRLYKAKNAYIHIIPISLSDVFEQNNVRIDECTESPPTLLFIGNVWYANIHGIKWFVKNVLDHAHIRLQITGYGMDALRDKFVHPKIQFLGYVQDLPAIIRKADYMINPVFKGGGMKVKTCEALMYGKNIIGTKESFEGYELDYTTIGAVCNSKEEFIYTLNNYACAKRSKFNSHSRAHFIHKYSFDSTLKQFKNLIQSLNDDSL